MDGKLKLLAPLGLVLVLAAGARAEVTIGRAADSSRLLAPGFSAPSPSLPPGENASLLTHPSAALQDTSASEMWAGTAWSGYVCEPYHGSCGGQMTWDEAGWDACGCKARNSCSSCNCLDRLLQNLSLVGRRCTVCSARAACDHGTLGTPCGSEPCDAQRLDPTEPETAGQTDQRQGDRMPQPLEPAMPTKPVPVSPPKNRLPKSAGGTPQSILKTAPASYEGILPPPRRLVVPLAEQAERLSAATPRMRPSETVLRFRTPSAAPPPPR